MEPDALPSKDLGRPSLLVLLFAPAAVRHRLTHIPEPELLVPGHAQLASGPSLVGRATGSPHLHIAVVSGFRSGQLPSCVEAFPPLDFPPAGMDARIQRQMWRACVTWAPIRLLFCLTLLHVSREHRLQT